MKMYVQLFMNLISFQHSITAAGFIFEFGNETLYTV